MWQTDCRFIMQARVCANEKCAATVDNREEVIEPNAYMEKK